MTNKNYSYYEHYYYTLMAKKEEIENLYNWGDISDKEYTTKMKELNYKIIYVNNKLKETKYSY